MYRSLKHLESSECRGKAALLSRRRAFTLLEVILASGLSLVLLAALYAALKLHLTFAQKAPEQVRRSQQARAILMRIARDVRAVLTEAGDQTSQGNSGQTTTADTASSGSNTGTSSATSSSTTTTTSDPSMDTTATDPDVYAAAFGMLGGSDWMQLYVAGNRPNLDDAELSALSGSVAQASNLVRVTYALTMLTGTADAQGRTERLALARSEVASIGAQRLDSSGDEADLRATTEYLCDDLAYVQFQYWDDTLATWVESWGVDVPVAPPRAIKVILSLQRPEEFSETQLGLGSGSTWDPYFELVIPIATWSPETSSESSEL
jgi:Tfp pilus assembly protein PilV